jgi:hypothetical protein
VEVPSFSRRSGAPYHFLNLGPPKKQTHNQKAMFNQYQELEKHKN